jgi:hypothetical protein
LGDAHNSHSVNAVAEKSLVSAILLAVTIPVFYGAEALITRHPVVPWLATRWDAKIPLVPAAVWIYMSWYLAPWLVLAAPPRDFRRVASAIVLTFWVCMICYVLAPAAIERPAILGQTLSERALRVLYAHDPPWNICPSFHAALCAILWRSARGGSLAKLLMTIWMAMICAACLLTKQHYIVDIAAGILTGTGSYAAASAAMRHFYRETSPVTRAP